MECVVENEALKQIYLQTLRSASVIFGQTTLRFSNIYAA